MENELLVNLYTLRSGISAISVEKDNLTTEEKKLEELQNKYSSINSSISNEESFVNSNKGQNKKDGFKSKKIELWSIYGFTIALLGAPIIYALTFVFYFICGAIGEIFNSGFTKQENNWLVNIYKFIFTNKNAGKNFLIFWAISAVVFFIGSILISIKSYRKEYKKYCDKKNYENEKLNSSINRSNKNKESLMKSRENLKEEIRKQQITVKNITNSSLANTKNIYETLVQKFKSILDVRDWKYIDLIIFYFETRRADTLKEALQQVDRRIQTDEIIDAVENASSSLANSINSSLMVLGNSLNNSINSLSKQLAIQHNEQLNKLSQINDQLISNNKQLKEMNEALIKSNKELNSIDSSINLQKALMSKIAIDSVSIMDDVDYMVYKKPSMVSNNNSKNLNINFNVK